MRKRLSPYQAYHEIQHQEHALSDEEEVVHKRVYRDCDRQRAPPLVYNGFLKPYQQKREENYRLVEMV